MAVRYNQNYGYSRSVAEKRRRHVFLRVFLFFLAGILILSGIGYWVMFSNFFRIDHINAEGIEKVDKDDFLKKIDDYKKKKILGLLDIEHNLLFFDKEKITADILAAFPIFEEVSITKNYPGELTVSVKERNTIGIWCFGVESERSCKYFDESGYLWGNALRTSGTILISVEDQSSDTEKKNVPSEFIKIITSIHEHLDEINVKFIKILIPHNSIDELHVYSLSQYYIIFSTVRSIEEQVQALSTFLVQKGNERSFQYIDLRVKDRVYYR